MSRLTRIRAQAREDYHATFSYDCSYTAPGQPPILGVSVRHHNRNMRLGNLDREGYAQMEEVINRMFFNSTDVGEPVRGAIVVLDDDGSRHRIETVMPLTNGFWPCDVITLP